jgi:hypothetical protein
MALHRVALIGHEWKTILKVLAEQRGAYNRGMMHRAARTPPVPDDDLRAKIARLDEIETAIRDQLRDGCPT